MKTVHMFNVFLLVMCIFGNLGVALKTGFKGDLDSDGDDSNDENIGSSEETNAPDSDRSSSSSGSAGGALDLNGLQNSLKEGGVDGLNNMLQSFAATMGSAGSANSANMHITKDANGQEIYDFRDVPSSSPPTLAPSTTVQTLPPTPPTQAPSLQSKELLPVKKSEADTQSSIVAAVSSSDARQEGPSPGSLPEAQLGKAVAIPLHATSKARPLPSIWESHKRKAQAKLPPINSFQKEGSAAQTVYELPDKTPNLMPKVETSAATDRTGAPPAAEPEVSRPAERPLPPYNTATSGSIAKLSSSLDEVRHSVDTLLTIALRKQDGTPSANRNQPTMELTVQNRQTFERVGALERENSKLERMFQVQAGRFEAIEAQQQDEERELGQVLHENSRLRAQLHKTNRRKIVRRPLWHSGSKKMAKKPADHHIRTYYHRRHGGAGEKH